MNKSARPDAGASMWNPNAGLQAALDAGVALKPGTITALMDVAHRSGNLLNVYAERLTTKDDSQAIDPQTAATTIQKFVQQATVNPLELVGKQTALSADLARLWQQTATQMFSDRPADPVITPGQQDKRFKNDTWTKNAVFDYLKQSYLLLSRYVESSVRDVKGVDPKLHHKVKFYTRQFVNALAPSNFAMTNPAVLEETQNAGRKSDQRLKNLVEDLERGGGKLTPKMTDLDAFKFGENIANTPGKIVFQNELMQLIQYAPTTATVHGGPC